MITRRDEWSGCRLCGALVIIMQPSKHLTLNSAQRVRVTTRFLYPYAACLFLLCAVLGCCYPITIKILSTTVCCCVQITTVPAGLIRNACACAVLCCGVHTFIKCCTHTNNTKSELHCALRLCDMLASTSTTNNSSLTSSERRRHKNAQRTCRSTQKPEAPLRHWLQQTICESENATHKNEM